MSAFNYLNPQWIVGRVRRLVWRFLCSRWARWGFVLVVLASAVAAAWVGWDRVTTRRAGEERLAAVVAKLDRDEPGWRGGRPPGPELEPFRNSWVIVDGVASTSGRYSRMTAAIAEGILMNPEVPPNVPLTAGTVGPWDGLETEPLRLSVARRLRDAPAGRRPAGAGDDERDRVAIGYGLAVNHLCRDAAFAAQAGNAGRARDSLRALLHTGRVGGDEPDLMLQQGREIAAGLYALTLERCLAQTEFPDRDLTVLAAGPTEELRRPSLVFLLRGWRASYHDSMNRFGYADPDRAEREAAAADAVERIEAWWYEPRRAEFHAIGLEQAAFAIWAAGRPADEALEMVRMAPRVSFDAGYRPQRDWLPIAYPVVRNHLAARVRWELAVLALGCERHRLRTGAWPASLDDLPAGLLPTRPADPFRLWKNAPPAYRYEPRPGGVILYSVGPNGTDDGGVWEAPGDPLDALRNGTRDDIAFRLYDPPARGRPAAPRRGNAPPPAPEAP